MNPSLEMGAGSLREDWAVCVLGLIREVGLPTGCLPLKPPPHPIPHSCSRCWPPHPTPYLLILELTHQPPELLPQRFQTPIPRLWPLSTGLVQLLKVL